MNSSAITGELIAVERYPDLGSDWRALESVADGSPFMAWDWVSVWLRQLPKTMHPQVFRACKGGRLLALGLLVDAPEHGLKRLFGNRSILLQEAGDAELDEITIEYAGLLIRRGCEALAYAALFDKLTTLDMRWRRLSISASAHATAIEKALPKSLQAFAERTNPSYIVDLAHLRASGNDYVASLGKSTRSGLRQTRRGYEKLGTLHIEVATEPLQAIEWLDALRVLHQRRWKSKGESGSFASAFFDAFHRDLIRETSASGFTQLLRISAGPVLIGYLYMIVWRNSIYFYNNGLNYGALQRHDRPGYLAHLLAIEKYLNDGLQAYDFLPGDADYKRMMSTHARTVHWIDIRRRGWQLMSERSMRVLSRRPLSVPLAGLSTNSAVHSRE